MKHKSLPKCKTTGKAKIKTKKLANKIKFRIWSHDPNSDIHDMHSYICPHCGFWHVGHYSKYASKAEL